MYTYFIEELPKQDTFNGKNGVGGLDRYQRISNLLRKKALSPLMSFVVFICQNFQESLVPFQTSAAMTNLVHIAKRKLVQRLFNKFDIPT